MACVDISYEIPQLLKGGARMLAKLSLTDFPFAMLRSRVTFQVGYY